MYRSRLLLMVGNYRGLPLTLTCRFANSWIQPSPPPLIVHTPSERHSKLQMRIFIVYFSSSLFNYALIRKISFSRSFLGPQKIYYTTTCTYFFHSNKKFKTYFRYMFWLQSKYWNAPIFEQLSHLLELKLIYLDGSSLT